MIINEGPLPGDPQVRIASALYNRLAALLVERTPAGERKVSITRLINHAIESWLAQQNDNAVLTEGDIAMRHSTQTAIASIATSETLGISPDHIRWYRMLQIILDARDSIYSDAVTAVLTALSQASGRVVSADATEILSQSETVGSS